MQGEYKLADFAGQHIYAGLDVAKKQWRVAIYVGDFLHKGFTQPADPSVFLQYLTRNFPGATYHTVYEAGYSGFWIHQALRARGVDSVVVHPADVPTTDKERCTKTDKVDAAKLARSLAKGNVKPLYVPEERELEDRALIRMRTTFVRKQTRCKNQIKSLLSFYGIQLPSDVADRYWSRSYLQWLERLTFTHPSGTAALNALVKELLTLREMIRLLTKQIRTLAQEDRYRPQVALLTTVPGISCLAAMTFLTEVVTIDRFRDLDHLASYVGLVPGEHSSGETEQATGIIPRRNSALRYILIECAWTAQHEDPALLQAFSKYSHRMPKNVAIVHIARKLLARMRFVLVHNQPYVKGVVGTAQSQKASQRTTKID